MSSDGSWSKLSTLPDKSWLFVPDYKLYRGFTPPENIQSCSGRWYTNTVDSARIYGNVGCFYSNSPLILDIGNPDVVSACREIFIYYVQEMKKPAWAPIFDTVIRTREDGKTERNSSYVSDTHVLNALLYGKKTGLIHADIAGFGSDALPTDCDSFHHHEVCFFNPQRELQFIRFIRCHDDLRTAEMALKRTTSLSRIELRKRRRIAKQEEPRSAHISKRLF